MPGPRRDDTRQPREIPANHIKAWRKRRKLTIEQLAEKTGLSVATISDVENRKADVTGKTLLEIADVLETTPGALLDAHPQKNEPFWEFFDSLSAEESRKAIAILKAWKDTSNG